MTLHHWQQLAQPNLGGILVPRPGVLTKDFRQLDIDLEEVYSLNDLEEDDVEASSFQLLPTSTPAKAKERPGGERGGRGRRGHAPQDASALLPRLPLPPSCALFSCSSLSLPPIHPRGNAPSAAVQRLSCSPHPLDVVPPLQPRPVQGAALGEASASVSACACSPLL